MPPLPVLPAPPALIVVVSGPSGVGKTALCKLLIAEDPTLVRTITTTTRRPRAGERDGVDYHFWTPEQFRAGMGAGVFLEFAEVHEHLYGTPKALVEKLLAEGRSPLLNVDVQGGRAVKAARPEAVLVFLLPPTMPALEDRLRGRATDDEPTIVTRLRNAKGELEQWRHYDYAVVNDKLEDAVASVQAVLHAERMRVSRRAGSWPEARK